MRFPLPTLGAVLAGVLDDVVAGPRLRAAPGRAGRRPLRGRRSSACSGVSAPTSASASARTTPATVLVHVKRPGPRLLEPRGARLPDRRSASSTTATRRTSSGCCACALHVNGGVSTIVSAGAVFDEADRPPPRPRRRADRPRGGGTGASPTWRRRSSSARSSPSHRGAVVSHYGRPTSSRPRAARRSRRSQPTRSPPSTCSTSSPTTRTFVLPMDFRPGDVQLAEQLPDLARPHRVRRRPRARARRDLFRLWLTLRTDVDLPDAFQTGGITDRTAAFIVTALAWEPIAFNERWERAVEPTTMRSFLRFEGPSGDVAEWTYGEFDGRRRPVRRTARRSRRRRRRRRAPRPHQLPGVRRHLAGRRCASARGSCRRTRWARSPELTGHLRRTCAARRLRLDGPRRRLPARRRPTRADRRSSTRPTPCSTCSAPTSSPAGTRRAAAPARRGDVHVRHDRPAEGRRVDAGQLRVHRRRRWPRRAACRPSTASSSCCRCSTPTPSSTASRRRSGPARRWPSCTRSRRAASCAQAAGHGATHASLFAAPMRMILARSEPPGRARRPAALLVRDEHHRRPARRRSPRWFGCRPRQLYGMTETVPAVLTEPADDPVPDSMGLPDGRVPRRPRRRRAARRR